MSRYPSDWDTIRKRIYARDNHTCQECGETDAELHAHHIKPISQGGGHEDENLITVCKDCHSNIHGYPIGGGRGTGKNGMSEEDLSNLAWGILAGILFSIFIPPLAVLGLGFSFLCLLGILIGLRKEANS